MLEVSYPAAGGQAGTKVSGLVAATDPSSAAEAGGLTGGLVLTYIALIANEVPRA